MATGPTRLERLHSWRNEGDDYLVSFTTEDGIGRSILLSREAAEDLRAEVLTNLPGRGETTEISTVTVLGHNVLVRPDGAKGLALQTRERGTLAFAFPNNDMIRKLASDLSGLAEAPSSKAAH